MEPAYEAAVEGTPVPYVLNWTEGALTGELPGLLSTCRSGVQTVQGIPTCDRQELWTPVLGLW